MSQEKKIAIVFSGQSRFALQGASQVIQYIKSAEGIQPDIFFHTWNLEDENIFPAWVNPQYLVFVDPKCLTEKLKPKRYLIETQDMLPQLNLIDICRTDANPKSILSMFYSMHKADNLRQNYEREFGFKYDLVFRSRFDFFPIGRLPIVDAKSNACYFPDLLRNQLAFCDWFFWGNSDSMSGAQNVMQKLQELIDLKIPVCGEDLLLANLQIENIQPIKVKCSGYLIRDVNHRNLDFGRVLLADAKLLFLQYRFKNIVSRAKAYLKSFSNENDNERRS